MVTVAKRTESARFGAEDPFAFLSDFSEPKEKKEGKEKKGEGMGEEMLPLAEVHRRIVEIVRSGTGSSDGRGGCDLAKLAPGYKRSYGVALDATKYG
jgi:hypothetical protein